MEGSKKCAEYLLTKNVGRCMNEIKKRWISYGRFTGKITILDATKEEINEAYEKNTGVLIADRFDEDDLDYVATPAVLCKNHGPFTWGKDAHEAVHNAVVLEEVAKMAARCEMINPDVKPAPQELQDKHYYRKHGANAYYGQPGK